MKIPRSAPRVTDIHKAPIPSHDLVYEPKQDKRDGLYSLLAIDREEVTTLLPPPASLPSSAPM